MHIYRVRPGYGTDKLIIEFGPTMSDEELLEDLMTVFKWEDIHTQKNEEEGFLDTTIFESSHGPFQMNHDACGFVFLLADDNQAAIQHLDEILRESGLFKKEEVDFANYPQPKSSQSESSPPVSQIADIKFEAGFKRITLMLIMGFLAMIMFLFPGVYDSARRFQAQRHFAESPSKETKEEAVRAQKLDQRDIILYELFLMSCFGICIFQFVRIGKQAKRKKDELDYKSNIDSTEHH